MSQESVSECTIRCENKDDCCFVLPSILYLLPESKAKAKVLAPSPLLPHTTSNVMHLLHL